MSKTVWEADPKEWPKASRDFVFLAAAFNDVGQALFGDEWTGREALPFPTPHADNKRKVEALFKAASLPPPPLTVGRRSAPPGRQTLAVELARPAALSKVSAEAVAQFEARWVESIAEEDAAKQAALSRRAGAVEWIAERARNGELATFGLWVGGGVPPVDLPASVWNVTDDWQLFEGCTVRRWRGGWHSDFLFLGAEGLRRGFAAQRGSQGKANAERKANEWLRQQFADASTVGKAKADFRRDARGLIDGLSDKAFERAWGNASADFPERRDAGRKPAQSVG